MHQAWKYGVLRRPFVHWEVYRRARGHIICPHCPKTAFSSNYLAPLLAESVRYMKHQLNLLLGLKSEGISSRARTLDITC